MPDRIKQALDQVKAPAGLRQQTLSYLEEQRSRRIRKNPWPAYLAAAACLVALLVGLGGWRMWNQTVAYVSVDINPSLELEVNRWNKVVKLKSFTEDAEPLLELPLKGKSYDQAVALVLQAEEERLAAGGLVLLTVQSPDEARQQDLLSQLEAYTTSLQGIRSECASASPELWQEAHSHGLSGGKYQAILELMEVEPDLTLEEGRHCSMGELKDRTHGQGRGQGGMGMGGNGMGGHHGNRHQN